MNRFTLSLLLGLAAFLAACSFTPPPKPKYFLLDPGHAPSMKILRPSAGSVTAAVSFVDVSAPFASDGFVYQTSGDRWETDPYNQFLVSPADMMTSIVRSWMRESGLYGDVAVPGAGGDQDYLIDCDLTELYGDFRSSSAPEAVLTLQAQVSKRADHGRVIVLRKTFTQRVKVAARTPAALIDAWNEGLRVELNLMLRELAENGN